MTHRTLPAADEDGFIIVRDTDGRFLASLGLQTLEAILSPDIHPPWILAEAEHDLADAFEFLDNTVFTSFNRQQMLAAAREIEERAWRIGVGRLYAGFQDREALEGQEDVYERLANHHQLSVSVFGSDEWDADVDDSAGREGDEIGRFWFVFFDGGGSDLEKAALIAEERSPGSYYGFWTYDPALVDDLIDHLESEYVR